MSWASIVGRKAGTARIRPIPVCTPCEVKSSVKQGASTTMNFDIENLPFVNGDDRALGVRPEEKDMIGVDIGTCSLVHRTARYVDEHHVTTNGITHCRVTRSLLRIAYPLRDEGFVLLSHFHPYFWQDHEGKHVGTTRYLVFIPISQTYMLVVANQFGHACARVVWSLLDSQAQASTVYLQKCWCISATCTCDGAWKEGNSVWEEGNKIMHDHAALQIATTNAMKEQLNRYLLPVLRDIVWSYCYSKF